MISMGKKVLGIQYYRYTSMEQNFSTTEFTNGQIIVGLSSVTLFSRFVINVQNGDNDNENYEDVVVDEDGDHVVVNQRAVWLRGFCRLPRV